MKAHIVDTVEALVHARDNWFNQKDRERPEMPFVKDYDLRDGELPSFTGKVTHYVLEGNVWVVTEQPQDGRLFFRVEEVIGRKRGKGLAEEVFYATLSIRIQVEDMAWALAEVGCTHVYRAWRLHETMLTGVSQEPTIYAEVAIFGDTQL